jgi:hypothetical protein
MKVYLAHNLTSSPVADDASGDRIGQIAAALEAVGVSVCDPAKTEVPTHNFSDRFDFCLGEIRTSNVLLVDASTRVGLGVGAEMMYARERCIPVFVICPPHSFYRAQRTGSDGQTYDWIHPFIHGLSTRLFDSESDCIAAIVASEGG